VFGQTAEEVDDLVAKIDGFEVADLPEQGELVLGVDQSLTVDDLRDVPLDDNPPQLGTPAETYDPRMTDDFGPGDAPYVAEGIGPFRFEHFNCEFNYGGWHNWAMVDYASTRGFGILSSYNHKPDDWQHVPEETSWLTWGGHVNWHKWMPEHGLEDGRYDLLVDVDVEQILADEGTFERKPGYDHLMIDMEHGRLGPEKLREQEWYPAEGTEAERSAFEKRYYDGYAKTYTGPVNAARAVGYTNISVYGWEPVPRTWHGLEKKTADPATDFGWNAFGKAIYESVDILNPSVYCFYWSPQNVAYTLASIDLNMQLVDSMPTRKPVRPYYWTLLHGGGGGWRWWKNQPNRDEDMRAMTAMCFFTGCDGFDSWNWSGTGTHHHPKVEAEADVIVGSAFDCAPEGGGEPKTFARYDALHILSVEEGTARFQLIAKGDSKANYQVGDDYPVYSMGQDELTPALRPQSAPVAAMIEGMALVKPLEYTLRHGEVKIDVSAQKQFAETLPIVRRVKLDGYHVLVTYDPAWRTQDEPRVIALDSFDGREGLSVRLPADAQTRLFVLRDQ
ncbi:MAG TPA: hypothetical protein QGH10_21770, partial [Armatimonadota bacterium]|nr:hypothetical protein [Armatimonadota bacterium]